MNHPIRYAVSIIALAAAGQAGAFDLVDTIGPGDAYTLQPGWAVGDPGDGSNFQSYSSFTAAVSANATAAQAAVWWAGGPVADLRFELRADDDGRPGALLTSALVSLTPAGGRVGGEFAYQVALSAGDVYWFGLTTTTAQTFVGWYQNPLGVLGTQALTGASFQQPGEWLLQPNSVGAFQISASLVPEAPAAAMYALGLAALALRLRQKLPGRR
jgi:hypothetical protein